MARLTGLSEATIQQSASPQIYARGDEYQRHGAVLSLILRGDMLHAEVQGSQDEPYQVSVRLTAGNPIDAACTCPYDWGDWCKHIVATLLASVRHPELLEERPALADLLMPLDRDQLRDLVIALARQEPQLTEAIEAQLAITRSARPAAPKLPPPDQKLVRRQVRNLFAGRFDDYHLAGSAVAGMERLVAPLQEQIAAGHARAILPTLEAITDEFGGTWFEVDDSDGELGEYFNELGKLWAEALLSADLTSAERAAWRTRLQDWHREAEDYGVEGLAIAIRAAVEGWGAPIERAASLVDDDEDEDDEDEEQWEDAYDDGDADLNDIRLTILERQGRVDEYLALARSTGKGRQYAAMLARRDQPDAAVQAARAMVNSAPDTLVVSQALAERGALDAALEVAKRGLDLSGPRGELATWLFDLAERAGQADLALRAAEERLQAAPTLAIYQQVKQLSGSGWPAARGRALAAIRKLQPWDSRISPALDILFSEKLIDDAIALVRQTGDGALILRVMDAATATRADWVITEANRQADAIMDAGRSQDYGSAVIWLTRARDAYRTTGRIADWQERIDTVRATHHRKYKLIGLIKRL